MDYLHCNLTRAYSIDEAVRSEGHSIDNVADTCRRAGGGCNFHNIHASTQEQMKGMFLLVGNMFPEIANIQHETTYRKSL